MIKKKVLLGKTIEAIKVLDSIEYILFSGGCLYLAFTEQDYYTYHDYSTSAMEISLIKDSSIWRRVMAKGIRPSSEYYY